MRVKSILALMVISVLICITSPASARPVYLGLKGGPLVSGVDGMDEALNIGLQLGVELWDIQIRGERIGSIAVEAEGTTTMIEGDVAIAEYFDGSWSVDSAALWLAYRTPHFLYVKGKVGWEYIDLSVKQVGQRFDDSDSGFSWGIGGGWRLNETSSIEVEYSYKTDLELGGDSGDIYLLSFGMNFNY